MRQERVFDFTVYHDDGSHDVNTVTSSWSPGGGELTGHEGQWVGKYIRLRDQARISAGLLHRIEFINL